MKQKIIDWLFKEYKQKLKNDSEQSLNLQMEAFKATLDIKDLIRIRFKSVRPGHPDANTILNDHLSGLDDVSRTSFLSKAKDVTSNEAFKTVVLSLLVDLQRKAGLDSPDMTEVNFNRASVNGVQLIEDELENLTSLYHKENEEKQKITEDERFSAL